MSRIVLYFTVPDDENHLSEGYEQALNALQFDTLVVERFMLLPESVMQPQPLGSKIIFNFPYSNDISLDVEDIWYYPMADVYWVCVTPSFDPDLSPEEFVRFMNESWKIRQSLELELQL